MLVIPFFLIATQAIRPTFSQTTVTTTNSTCREPAEYIKAVQRFGELFVNSTEVLDDNSTSPFADNVIGRVDVTTNFPGQELNIEYIFGLFHELTLQNTTQLFGPPVNATVQQLVIDAPITYASFIINFLFKTLNNLIVPLQVDLLFRFDKDLLITSYDATLRRLPQLLKLLKPQLAEAIRAELNAPDISDDEAIVTRAVIDTCAIAMEFCVGDLVQYESTEDCTKFLTAIPFGDVWEGGLNTTWCRYIHKNMVPHRPDVHCPHVGPSGGGMCNDRVYNDIVYNPPYTESLIHGLAEC